MSVLWCTKERAFSVLVRDSEVNAVKPNIKMQMFLLNRDIKKKIFYSSVYRAMISCKFQLFQVSGVYD